MNNTKYLHLVQQRNVLFQELKKAYESSTAEENTFLALVEKIAWDGVVRADEEILYYKDKLVLVTENLDPSNQNWKPSVVLPDGTIVQLGT